MLQLHANLITLQLFEITVTVSSALLFTRVTICARRTEACKDEYGNEPLQSWLPIRLW